MKSRLLLFVGILLCAAGSRADDNACPPVLESTDCLTRTIDRSSQSDTAPALLVDIRSADTFNRLRVNSSLHIAPHTLKTKGYLRDRRIIILGEPSDYRTLRRLCAELKAAHFSRYEALLGGIASWGRSAPDTLVGDTTALTDVISIQPMELLAEVPGAPWLLVDITEKARDGQILGRPLRALPAKRQQASFVALLRAMWPSDDHAQPTRIALIGEPLALSASTLAKLRETFPPGIVFHIKGGISALENAAALQLTVATSAQRSVDGGQCR